MTNDQSMDNDLYINIKEEEEEVEIELSDPQSDFLPKSDEQNTDQR